MNRSPQLPTSDHLLLGFLSQPYSAGVIQLPHLEATALHRWLRKLRTQWREEGRPLRLVLVADPWLDSDARLLTILNKAIRMTGFEWVGVLGEQAQLWSHIVGVEQVLDKPEFHAIGSAVFRRNASVALYNGRTQAVADLTRQFEEANISQTKAGEIALAVLENKAAGDNLFSALNVEVDLEAVETIEKIAAKPTLAPIEQTVEVMVATQTQEGKVQALERAERMVEAHTEVAEPAVDKVQAPAAEMGVVLKVAQEPADQQALQQEAADAGQAVAEDRCVMEAEESEAGLDGRSWAVPDAAVKLGQIQCSQAPSQENPDKQNQGTVSEQEQVGQNVAQPEPVEQESSQSDTVATGFDDSRTKDVIAQLTQWRNKVDIDLADAELEVVEGPNRAFVAPRRVSGIVRTGTLIEHEGDVIIEGSVHDGAEVRAGGDIHVYGRAGGRLFAGCGGNAAACLYINNFDAEIVGVDGAVRVFEEIPANWAGAAMKIQKDPLTGKLRFYPLARQTNNLRRVAVSQF